ncbi:MAG TPA: hypothetical protein PLL78_03510 [Fimbriimonadaceae bacterium]|nr:hypothetical protein [Fimbriimonadaceae bacterium]HRJ95728.1 hypothetical protein [Fimbriimonadaceae bacterium]
MKDKRKDLLIAYAFGDLTEEEMAAFEANDAERAELDRLARLRGDLKHLNSVPECQLSVERVRDAILQREIRQRRDWKPWIVAMPAAAALALLAFFATRPGDAPVAPNANPIVVESAEQKPFVVRSEPDLVTSPPITDADVVQLVGITLSALGARPVSTDEPVRVASLERKSPTVPRRRTTPTAVAIRSESKKESTHDRTTPVAAPTTQPQPIEPIVMISNDEDKTTGARRANEVETSNDVVIGG